MKIEELREITAHTESIKLRPDVSPMDRVHALSKYLSAVIDHFDALLDVAEAAQEVIRTCGGLPGTEVLHEMEKALEKLEAIK